MADRNDKISLFTSRLPPEIRNEIYQYLLMARNARIYAYEVGRRIVPLVHGSSWEEPLRAKLWPCSHFRFESAILRTNKKIYNEAIRVLYHKNLFIRFSTSNSSLAQFIKIGGIPTLYDGERGSKAHTFEHCAMSVIFGKLPVAKINKDKRYHYVVAYDDLQSLCQAFLYLDATEGSRGWKLSESIFEITIHHQFNEDLSVEPRPTSIQRRLLDSFTGLHSVCKFTIAGHVNTTYANSVIVRVTSPAPSIEETVDRVMAMTREARNLSDLGRYSQAIDKYKSALVQTFNGTRCLTAENVLHKGLLVGRTESFAFRYLDFMLKSKMAMCHAELDEWEEAHYWACDATCTNFFPTKYAEVVYLMGWVVDAESNKAVHILETLVEKLNNTAGKALYVSRNLSALEEKMRSKEGMDSLRDLKAVMKGLAKRDWVRDSDQE